MCRIPGRSPRATMIIALVALTGTSSLRAAAQPAPAASEQEAAAEAKKHYEEGTKAFNLAEFARAVSEFKAAYNLKPDPLLLYNIAQSFRLGDDDAQAVLFYKSFLRNMPDAPNRREVEGRIRTLDKRVAERKREAAAAALASPPTASAPAAAPVPELSPPALSGVPSVPPAQENPFAGPRSDRSAPPLDLSAKAAPTSTSTATSGTMATTSTSTEEVHQIDLSQRSATETKVAADQSDDRPVYKKWWFWAGIGAVAVVGIAIAANVNRAPSTPLGLYEPAFK